MPRDHRDLLELLKAELTFLESGGYEYARQQDVAWLPTFYLEDSPSCFHRWRAAARAHNCSACVLIHLVPAEHRAKSAPCRHIPLNAAGETIESFYKSGTKQELEWALDKWLREKIRELEEQKNERRKGCA